MTDAPPAFALVHSLALIGIQVRPEIVPAVLSWSGVIGAALIAAWAGILKTRSDKRLSMNDLLSRVDKQGDDIEGLKRQLDTLRMENRDLRDIAKDQDETLSDYAGHILNLDVWMAEGGIPPAPAKSWRIREHIEIFKEAKNIGGGA